MTTFKLPTTPELGALLIAGGRAAFAQLHIEAKRLGIEIQGETYEQYAGGTINILTLDIVPTIDAVVLETIVQLEKPPARRPWWKVWA